MTEPARPDTRANEVRVRLAFASDANALTRLINAAFVVERPIFDSDRTSLDVVRELLVRGKFLIIEDPADFLGCVYVELCGDRGYIGLLSVEPSRQGSGLGSKLMHAAEELCRQANCAAVDLRVVSARAPLPTFYRRFGFMETHTSELPADVHPKVPCHFIHMSKTLSGI